PGAGLKRSRNARRPSTSRTREREPNVKRKGRPVTSADQRSMLPTVLHPELFGVKPFTGTNGKSMGSPPVKSLLQGGRRQVNERVLQRRYIRSRVGPLLCTELQEPTVV